MVTLTLFFFFFFFVFGWANQEGMPCIHVFTRRLGNAQMQGTGNAQMHYITGRLGFDISLPAHHDTAHDTPLTPTPYSGHVSTTSSTSDLKYLHKRRTHSDTTYGSGVSIHIFLLQCPYLFSFFDVFLSPFPAEPCSVNGCLRLRGRFAKMWEEVHASKLEGKGRKARGERNVQCGWGWGEEEGGKWKARDERDEEGLCIFIAGIEVFCLRVFWMVPHIYMCMYPTVVFGARRPRPGVGGTRATCLGPG